MMSIKSWAVSGALLAATALAAPAVLADDNVVKIGVMVPFTGAAAADGEEALRGVTLAVEEMNAAGGVAGYTFEVVTADTGETAATATTAFQRLTGDPDVQVVLTGYATSSNFEIELMAEVGMPYILAANSQQTADIIAPDPDAFGTVWSLTPSYNAYNTDLVPVINQLVEAGSLTLPNREVALITSDNPYSRTIYEGLKEAFIADGWEITADEIVPSGEINDWRAFLTRVRSDPPAILINTDWLPPNAATFVTQFAEQPTNSLVFIQYAPSVPEFIELTADNSTGIVYNLLGGVLDTPANPRADEIQEKFSARWEVESGTYGIALYEQTYIYFDALAQVGDPTDWPAIGAAIGSTDKQTAQGRVIFDPDTHLARQGDDFIPIQFYQIWEGERVLFSPEGYSTGEFRMPPWMQ
ncbi:MAG: ABC transporter substrate-binding protein [Pseudomonadota bacterium]